MKHKWATFRTWWNKHPYALIDGLIVGFTLYFLWVTTAQLLVPFRVSGFWFWFTYLAVMVLSGLMARRLVLGLRQK